MIVDDGIKIKFTNDILIRMKKYVQWRFIDNEAGGILIGRENISDDSLIIEFITEPLAKDKRSRMRFIRKDQGHMDFYKKLYDNNAEIYAYIGEWHTHPEDNPHYSSMDLKNWKKILKKSPKAYQYHIIIGRKSIAIWKLDRRNSRPKLIKEVEWNEAIL